MTEKEIANIHLSKMMKIENVHYSFSGDPYNRKVEYIGDFLINDKHSKNAGQFFIRTSLSSCPACTLKRGNYYEAIIQLRGGYGNDLENVLSYSVRLIDEADSRDIFITRTEKKREGYDLLISDKQFARNIGRRIVEEYGGTYTETSHLVGRKEGNEIYRITVSVRIPSFHPGDLIKIRGEMYMVEKIKSNEVILYNIEREQETRRKIIDISDFILYERKENLREATFLYREGNVVYVLDPFDNRERALIDKSNRKRIFVAKMDDDLVIVPLELLS